MPLQVSKITVSSTNGGRPSSGVVLFSDGKEYSWHRRQAFVWATAEYVDDGYTLVTHRKRGGWTTPHRIQASAARAAAIDAALLSQGAAA
jgi:hypothetical protein